MSCHVISFCQALKFHFSVQTILRIFKPSLPQNNFAHDFGIKLISSNSNFQTLKSCILKAYNRTSNNFIYEFKNSESSKMSNLVNQIVQIPRIKIFIA